VARETQPKKVMHMASAAPAKVKVKEQFTVEFDREADGRWIAEVPEFPGVLAYGTTQENARAKAEALAFRVLADRREARSRVKSA
jgi:predicted RNase H-like HicB family nuclease